MLDFHKKASAFFALVAAVVKFEQGPATIWGLKWLLTLVFLSRLTHFGLTN